MVLHADYDGAVEGGVGLAVAAAVEPVALVMPEEAGIGATPQSRAQAAFGADAVDVVASDDEHLGSGVGTDAERVDQLRHELAGEFFRAAFSWDLISSLSCCQRRAIARSGVLRRGEARW